MRKKYCKITVRGTGEVIDFGVYGEVIKSTSEDKFNIVAVKSPIYGSQIYSVLNFAVTIIPLIDYILLWVASKFKRKRKAKD